MPRYNRFHNGGEEEYFTGSTDCVKRNLEGRVPVEAPQLRGELSHRFDTLLEDTSGAWERREPVADTCAFAHYRVKKRTAHSGPRLTAPSGNDTEQCGSSNAVRGARLCE